MVHEAPRRATNTSPPASADLEAAIKQYDAGAYDQAAELFAALLPRAPDDPVVLRLQGLALTRAGKPAQGLPLLARARQLAPQQPLTHLHYGIGLQAIGRFGEAAALFRACMSLLPRNPAPALNLAACLLELGQPDAARTAAQEAVTRGPNLAEAHYTLGVALLASQALTAAQEELTKAVSLNPRLAKAWISLGAARYRLSDVEGATFATNKALTIEPRDSLAEANLAVLLALRGDQDEALRRLRDVLARDPGCASARVNLGGQLLVDREPAEALAVLDGIPPPGSLGVQWRVQRVTALYHLGRGAEARAELDAITDSPGEAEILLSWRLLVFALLDRKRDYAEELAKRIAILADAETGALIEHRIIAHFDLARYRNSRGERDQAFQHWRKGHALIARSQPFSRTAYAEFFAASKRTYTHDQLLHGPRANNRDIKPVFIVGLPRSGTTLTEQILAAHSAVHGAGERPALHNWLRRLTGSVLQAESVRKAANLARPVLNKAARDYLVDLHKLAPDARYVLDKMPGNALHLGFIATLFPRARIILCERDLRDVGLSIFQFRFFGYHPYAHDLQDLGWYIAQHQKLMDHWRAVLPLPMMTVRLNDWIDDFSGTLARILAFLDLPHEDACERFYEQRRKVRTASVDQVRRPVNARGVGRWRHYASHLEPLFAELERAEVIAATAADAHFRAAELSRIGQPRAACGLLQSAIAENPGDARLLATMATFRLEAGQHDEARSLAEQAVTLAPHDVSIHRVLCNVLAYCAGVGGADLSAAMIRCGALLPRAEAVRHRHAAGPVLRVGLVGAFHHSPVTALTIRAFEALDPGRFSITCFSAGGNTDTMTARFRTLGAFHDLSQTDDAVFADRIRTQNIDILIDLTGYLRIGRIGVFARRPAPVQIKWAGAQYHTTGIAEIGFMISDERETPPELAPLYTETLLTMPDSYACWSPPEDAPEPAAAPHAQNGLITFGSFNSLMKVTRPTIAAWSAILGRVPDSRLILVASAFNEGETSDYVRGAFQSHGIASERLEMRGSMPHHALLAAYGEIDIALSPFPYNAGVTLLEGLWMGVPCVALSGETFASRHGASHLAAAGLADWATASQESYVARAVAAATDRKALCHLRTTLRATLQASALCDAPRFANALGAALEHAARKA
jgi:tetratricopeptide (TPR) repeat protein